MVDAHEDAAHLGHGAAKACIMYWLADGEVLFDALLKNVPTFDARCLDNVEGAQAVGLHAQLYSTWEDFTAGGLPASYGLPAPGFAEDVARRQ